MDKSLQFSGLWAIILGGSTGFGFAAIEKLCQYGINVAVLYRERSATEKVLLEKFAKISSAQHVTILPYNINALDETARNSFISEFSRVVGQGKVRVLLHSIARGNLKPLISDTQDTEDDYLSVLSVEDIQLTTYAMSNSLLDWTRSILKAGLFNQDARVIGLTSEGAHKYWDAYAAVSIAKAALESLTTYMAVEFSRFGIKTNLIQAGITDSFSLKKIPGYDKLIDFAQNRNPMGRITKPDDIANVIYLLCTDEAGWINGSLIHADGGEHCR